MPLLEGYRLSTQCMDHPLVSVGLYHVSYTLQAGYTVFPVQCLIHDIEEYVVANQKSQKFQRKLEGNRFMEIALLFLQMVKTIKWKYSARKRLINYNHCV